jgi:iron complex outermembrane receptor protein
MRRINYTIDGMDDDLRDIAQSHKYNFFNPKAGLMFNPNEKNKFYASFGIANREPKRSDFTDAPQDKTPQPETLFDYEAGYKFNSPDIFFNANLYYMNYKDQLVLTGELDDVGDAIRQNVAKSYRAGIELQGGVKLLDKLRFDANVTLSKNKIDSFDYVVYDTQYDPITWSTVSYEPVVTNYKDTDISFSPSVIAGGTLGFEPIKNLNLSLISKYVGKQYLDNTSSDSKSMDAYSVTNFGINYKLQPKWIREVQLNLLVNNIFNTKYVSNGYTYSYYYRPQGSNDNAVTEVFYYPQATINFLTGITLKF